MTNNEAIYFAAWILLTAVVLAGLWRIARGPSLFDRLVGFDTIMIAIVGWIVVFSIHERTGEFLELILVVTALGFFATVAYYYYLSQPSGHSGEGNQGEE